MGLSYKFILWCTGRHLLTRLIFGVSDPFGIPDFLEFVLNRNYQWPQMEMLHFFILVSKAVVAWWHPALICAK